MQDRKNFLEKIKEFKLYMVEFDKNSIMKEKIYLFNCIVYSFYCYLIIIITYDECIFFANNSIQKVLTQKEEIFLQSKN